MARFKEYSYAQRLMLPVALDEQILPGTFEYTVHDVVENRIDISLFEQRFNNDATGRLAYNPKILLKVVLLAYSRGMTSSREIERACRENVIFVALACGQTFDHSTIAEFVSSLQIEMMPVFLKVLLICQEMGLLGGSFFAIDGTKVPSSAAKQWSGTWKELAHRKELLEGQLKRLLERHLATDRNGNAATVSEFPEKQKIKLEQKIKKIERFLEEAKPRRGARGRELKANLTDPDSGKMKTANGTIQGYNPQAVVDGKCQIIVAGAAMSNSSDSNHLRPMVDEYKANLEKIGFSSEQIDGITVTADSGYYSFSNLEFCRQQRVDAYIPDQKFRARDPRYERQSKHRTPLRFPISSFQYDPERDVYICPAGNALTSYGRRVRRGELLLRQYNAKREVCEACPNRAQCLQKAARRRVIQVPACPEQARLVDDMMRRIDSPEGKLIYGRRFGVVEPVFANIKAQKALRRFSHRGRDKVNVQWLLWCVTHNIGKLAPHYAEK